MNSYRNHTEQQLITSIKNDEVGAFDELYRRYAKKLLAFSRSFFWDKADAEEVVQEVFIKTWENRSKIKENSSFGAFIFTCIKNRIYNELREKQKSVRLDELDFDLLMEDSQENLESNFEEQKKIAQTILGLLPPMQKNIFTLNKLEGYSHQEIAEMLNISIRTVEHHIYLAKKQIKIQIHEQSPLVILVCLFLLL